MSHAPNHSIVSVAPSAYSRCFGKHYASLLILSILLVLLPGWMSPTVLAQTPGTIKAGDTVYVEVYRAPTLTGNQLVDSRGFIQMNYAGNIKISGVSLSEAAARISSALSPYLRTPRVTVNRSQGFNTTIMINSGRSQDMQTEIIQLKNANAETLHTTVQGIVSEGGNVSFDPNTNSLLITDTPKILSNIKSIVHQLDTMQSQLIQVSIETRIAEVRVGALKELGIKWFAQGDHVGAGFNPPTTEGATENPFIPGATNALSGGIIEDAIGFPIPGQTFLGYTNSGIDVRALLDMLVTDEDAEILANPTTMTVNHQKSHIEMTDKIPYIEFGTFITGETSFTTKFIDAGISLDVTPHVYEDEVGPYVKLDINPSVSFPSDYKNGVPVLSIRESQTIANVRDKQTLVLGGIISEAQRETVSKVPILGELPLIGALFRNKSKGKERTELMIFVTPTIHQKPEDATWDKMVVGETYSLLYPPATDELSSETAAVEKE